MKWESIVFGIVVLVVGAALAFAYFALVDAYRGRFRKGELERAIADLDEAIRLDPKNANAHSNRGLAHYCKDDYVRAIADLDEAIRLDPKKANLYRNRSLVYDVWGGVGRGNDDYDEAIRLDPKIDDNEPMLLGSNDEAIPLEPIRSR